MNPTTESGDGAIVPYTTSEETPLQTEGLTLESPQEIYQVAARFWWLGNFPEKRRQRESTLLNHWREIDVFVECDSPLSVHHAAKTQISARFNVEHRKIEILAVQRVERNPRLDAQRGESDGAK